MIKALNHLGIAVKSLDESVNLYKKLFGEVDFHFETILDQNVKIASFELNGMRIELTEPLNENSPISKFLEKKGEGIHHIAFESDDVNNDLKRINDLGIDLIDKESKLGAHNMKIAFLHPKSTRGVLMELCQVNQ